MKGQFTTGRMLAAITIAALGFAMLGASISGNPFTFLFSLVLFATSIGTLLGGFEGGFVVFGWCLLPCILLSALIARAIF